MKRAILSWSMFVFDVTSLSLLYYNMMFKPHNKNSCDAKKS